MSRSSPLNSASPRPCTMPTLSRPSTSFRTRVNIGARSWSTVRVEISTPPLRRAECHPARSNAASSRSSPGCHTCIAKVSHTATSSQKISFSTPKAISRFVIATYMQHIFYTLSDRGLWRINCLSSALGGDGSHVDWPVR